MIKPFTLCSLPANRSMFKWLTMYIKYVMCITLEALVGQRNQDLDWEETLN